MASEGDFRERDSNRNTVKVGLSGYQLSGLFDYPDFFSRPVFVMNINKQNFKSKKIQRLFFKSGKVRLITTHHLLRFQKMERSDTKSILVRSAEF